MKYISKMLALFAVGMMVTACEDKLNEVSYPLEVTAPSVSKVRAETAVVSAIATGSHITYRGFCYGTTPNPTVDGKKMLSATKEMQVILPWLDRNTTYYVRAFAQTKDELIYSEEVTFTTTGSSEVIDDDEEEQTLWPAALQRVSVHDPSIVWDPTSNTYYVFGSHRAAASTPNMMTWTSFTAPWKTATSNDAANVDAFTTPEVTKVKKGGQEYDLNFNALAWSQRGSSDYNVDGNMWAPDVIYNKQMQKWCMYLSINGDHWYSSIIMLTADNIAGPYRYQAPVVMSGFHTGDAYKDTDLEIVLGTQASLPDRYNNSIGTWNYGQRFPNCIDPCVFYDEEDKLWMSYGSWSGGIYMLELDEQTGLRDYDVTYTLTGSGNNITVDPYFGKKIAGGFYSSGEASYIEYIGGYYYLFVTNGGLTANGGYQMRVFRSLNPDGPYVDSKNSAALLDRYYMNYGPGENDGNRGVNIFGAYGEWGNQTVGAWSERSQGHNSVLAAYDGRAYLVYHTRFQDRDEGHEVRVHQLFQNEEGWLVAAPFEYTGEVMKTSQIARKQYVAADKIPGSYKLMTHNYKLNYETMDYSTPVDITLNADGTISGGATGTWAIKAGTSYITVNIGQEYKGVMVIQTLEPKNDQVPCFTALSAKTGVTIWGYRYAD